MCTGINFNPLYGMLDPRYSPPEELVMPQSESAAGRGVGRAGGEARGAEGRGGEGQGHGGGGQCWEQAQVACGWWVGCGVRGRGQAGEGAAMQADAVGRQQRLTRQVLLLSPEGGLMVGFVSVCMCVWAGGGGSAGAVLRCA